MQNVTLSERKAVSVWVCWGRPVNNGARAAHRGGTYLLALTAGTGDVMNAFIEESSLQDAKTYDAAEIERIQYIGWTWLPSEPI